MANLLKDEKSLYLQQHKDNPVNWQPWGDKALEQARAENKLLVVSIGYSSCHWCHVMERESFVDPLVASLMNEHYINIKVDREERPDIDQIYIAAVQIMTGSAGWPLNCICLPDGRPVYGGTYFTNEQWRDVLNHINKEWEENPQLLYEYAEKLKGALNNFKTIPNTKGKAFNFSKEHLEAVVEQWKEKFDEENGGYQGAPKFPLPNDWLFLLKYGTLSSDKQVVDQVHRTLKMLSWGGIYDQLAGGFARYSVDRYWKVPHFEKMLYDNAQLLSLYSDAYRQRPSAAYKAVIKNTSKWLKDNMMDANGGFYSALDAESESVEGKYYVFTKQEIEKLIPQSAALVATYFNCASQGNWELEDTNVLFCSQSDEDFAAANGIELKKWQEIKEKAIDVLLKYRNSRIPPATDKKQICAWNALLLEGFCDAYLALGETEYLTLAKSLGKFINTHLVSSGGQLLHIPADPNRNIPGFLDDYSLTASAFIKLYQVTFEVNWLQLAQRYTDEALELFYDQENKHFSYSQFSDLIVNKADTMDDVIPSGVSTMARNLHRLGKYFDNNAYNLIADELIQQKIPQIDQFPTVHSGWLNLLVEDVYGTYEVVITGPDSQKNALKLNQEFIPNVLLVGGTNTEIPLMEGKDVAANKLYICKDKTCRAPVDTISEAIYQLRNF
ncbi:MAG TPA: thioredoxin domain-containing protein [Candidatus Sphingobacterium stercoripullorum]|uniref:Thioredoxin domain-containing protein n=1 Tax=Candidatus Sphingobacterium stercoripullorum TaxID=2838759 RepID=A0A9D1W646_9SPHI|nr:thioredoxin domain-containing protein [Candidatus Sphingobacterium stercoripullorum]